MARTVIPFGPQHPVFPEPIQLKLECEDERVVGATPAIGYVHRGIEKACELNAFRKNIFLVERVCGICSVQHALCYCEGIEKLSNVIVPTRARFLRTAWAELSRLHSHLLWLGLAADAFGFENLFMQTWRLRERVLNIFEKTTGGRVIFSVCKVGGIKKNITDSELKALQSELDSLSGEIKEISDVFLNDSSIKNRLCGIGPLSREDAWHLGAVGPVLRASGVSEDNRKLGYAKYGELEFEPIVEKDGDCYARCKVRIREMFQSLDLMRQVVSRIKGDAIDTKVTGLPCGESFLRLEQPRGEVFYYVKGNGTRFLERFRARTPTFANIAPALEMLKGSELADVPSILLSIDPCISCTER